MAENLDSILGTKSQSQEKPKASPSLLGLPAPLEGSPSGKENRVERVRLAGGIAGVLGTRPRLALEGKMAEVNAEGWRVIQVIPDDTGNLLIYILRWLILLVTLFIYTPANGYFLILEREVNPSAVKLSAKEQEMLEQIKREEK